ncbi:hypothetical protein SELMODRAFT_421564 [Selaginella moellendorffii]|uniref:Peptidase S8/S53 domain-containing protein n=1 Tax=Selaginella moellendorffii TaxID=88036 RepID=D8SFN5_SELML|nr:hypothetical protein SELMODRAFT_421564 [Selaginella moellendorffii]
MSCPHVSEIVALLKAYRPEWSPAAINSAIVTTGFVTDNSGEPIKDAALLSGTFGGDHINPSLVYDAKVPEFTDFLCGLRQEIRNVSTFANLKPSVPHDDAWLPAISTIPPSRSLRSKERGSSTGE